MKERLSAWKLKISGIKTRVKFRTVLLWRSLTSVLHLVYLLSKDHQEYCTRHEKSAALKWSYTSLLSQYLTLSVLHFKSEGGTGDGWVPTTVAPDVSLSDLGFFSSLKHDVSQACSHCTDPVEMMNSVEKAFWDYPADKLEDKWACYYNNLRSIMHELGGSDYKLQTSS